MRTLCTWIMMAWMVVVAAPVAAQTSAADDGPTVAATFGMLRFGEHNSSKTGLTVSYNTRPLTGPMSSLGIKASAVGEFGVHWYDGGSLALGQGGIHLTAEGIGTPRVRPYGRAMFGVGRFYGFTETFLTYLAGFDFPLENQPFMIRAEIGQTWDFFDGGANAAVRLMGGVSYTLP